MNSIKKNDIEKIISSIIPFVNDIVESDEKMKRNNIELHENMLYLKYKEQEEAYLLWKEKSDNLKGKIEEIDISLSDISLELIKQKLNELLKKVNKNTIIH